MNFVLVYFFFQRQKAAEARFSHSAVRHCFFAIFYFLIWCNDSNKKRFAAVTSVKINDDRDQRRHYRQDQEIRSSYIIQSMINPFLKSTRTAVIGKRPETK